MRVNLLETDIDLTKLRYGIETFEMINGECPKYVVMNEQTRHVIESKCIPFYIENGIYFSSVLHADSIFGIPIAYSNSLSFGIVDIV